MRKKYNMRMKRDEDHKEIHQCVNLNKKTTFENNYMQMLEPSTPSFSFVKRWRAFFAFTCTHVTKSYFIYFISFFFNKRKLMHFIKNQRINTRGSVKIKLRTGVVYGHLSQVMTNHISLVMHSFILFPCHTFI